MFLTSFDYLSVAARKNPLGTIDAFVRAFPEPSDAAALVVKTINGSARPDDQDRVRFAAHGRGDIVFIDESVSAAVHHSLLKLSDCFLSVHRSEGYGFNLVDSLALGRPVLATGYGGNLEFMHLLPEWLISFELTSVGEGHHPYPSEALWAEPDIADAATRIRRIAADPPAARALAAATSSRLLDDFSAARTGSMFSQRLREVVDESTTSKGRATRRRRLQAMRLTRGKG